MSAALPPLKPAPLGASGRRPSPCQVRARSVECRKTLTTNDKQRQTSGQVRADIEPVTRAFATAARALTRRRTGVRAPQRPPAMTTFSGDVTHPGRAGRPSPSEVRGRFEMLRAFASRRGDDSRRDTCQRVRKHRSFLAVGWFGSRRGASNELARETVLNAQREAGIFGDGFVDGDAAVACEGG